MKNIALIAESVNDAISIKNLLLKKYPNVRFTHIARKRRGSQLDSNKLKTELKAEVEGGGFSYYLFIRDLDDLETNTLKIKTKEKWFKDLDKMTKSKSIFLLNIYELEALILSDIQGFNKIFGTKLKFAKDPMRMKEPKEHLMRETKKYQRTYRENDCPEIFSQLDIKILEKNCRYFKEFIVNFDKRLKKAA